MIKKLEDKIIDVLKEYPKARDNDQYLVTVLWVKQLKSQGYNPKEMTAWELLGLLGSNKLINTDSVSRCRQKVQENHPDLRGDNYEKRQSYAKSVKEELKNWTGKLF